MLTITVKKPTAADTIPVSVDKGNGTFGNAYLSVDQLLAKLFPIYTLAERNALDTTDYPIGKPIRLVDSGADVIQLYDGDGGWI